MKRMLSIAAIVASGLACGGDDAQPQPPVNSPINGTPAGDASVGQGSSNLPGSSQNQTGGSGNSPSSGSGSCPSACPDECDALGQCLYEINPDARYRVELEQANVSQAGAKVCSLAGVIGLYTPTCDLYVILRARGRDYRSATSFGSNSVFGGVVVPEITVADLEQYFEVHVMDENYQGSDVPIARCRPRLTREILESGVMILQCGGLGALSSGQGDYMASSNANIRLRLTALDGGAVTRRGSQTGGTGTGGTGTGGTGTGYGTGG